MDHDSIEQQYRQLGFEKGWSFLACPEARLHDATVAMVGANPGGGGTGDTYSYKGIWSCETMNAFYDEPSSHQSQVRLWHEMIPVAPGQTLCAEFIPFRSPDLARLGRRNEAIAFARDLWRWVLEQSPAKLFITMGPLPATHLVELLGARPFIQNWPTGWGKTTIDVFETSAGYRVVRMPHPSQYKVLGRLAETDDFFKSAIKLA